MKRISIIIILILLVGYLFYNRYTNISFEELQGQWNIHNIYTTGTEYGELSNGILSLSFEGQCYIPKELDQPNSFYEGKWNKMRKSGNVYIAISTPNPFYNDTFLVAFFEQKGMYRTMVLETSDKRILLKRYPPPVWGHPSPGNDWPKQYIDKKKKEDERNQAMKDI